jgi:hypothetical protein
MSCAVHTLLCRERYDAPRELFDDRSTHVMRLVDAAAQASHLVYEYTNPASAGLVKDPGDMPGRTVDFQLWKGGCIEVERPAVFSRRRHERLVLELTPPPLLYWAFDGDMERLVYHMDRLAADSLRSIHGVRKRPVLGVKDLTRLHPWSEPRTMRETGARPVPTFRIGARGIVGHEARVHSAHEVRDFRERHRAARDARRCGDFGRPFPYGTYAMRVHHGAPTDAEPPEGAIVSMPGPLLADVKAMLAEGRHDRDRAWVCSVELLGEVRRAFVDEAQQIVEEADLDLHGPSSVRVMGVTTTQPDGEIDRKRQPAVVRHRFQKSRLSDLSDAPSRLITLRDRRMGRPPSATAAEKHGIDPPA